MFIVHNPAELFSGLVITISPPPQPLFRLLDPKRTEIVQGTRVTRTLNPPKENPWPDRVKYHLSVRGKRKRQEAKASAAYRWEYVRLNRAAHVVTPRDGE
jgi:hypothetical protein